MRPAATITTAILFIGLFTQAQTPWRIDKLGLQEGLSEGYVYAIHQDKKGFIWIGTHGGLNRYDGYGFKLFQYNPFDSTSLGDNSVFFLKEDERNGKFWIGGSSCLNEFDPATFKNIRYRYPDKQIEFSDGVFLNEHEILLACEYNVLLFNTLTKKFTKVPIYDENDDLVSLSRVENLCTDRKGNYMIMSKTGIFFFDVPTRSCKRKTNTSPDFSAFYQYQTFNVLEDKSGYYWIATNKKGLIRFDPRSKEIKTMPLPSNLKIESLRFDVVTEDSQGNIWGGCSNGLFKVNPQTLASEYFSSDRTKRVFLSHPEINVIREDKNHFMWIGTVGGGVNKMVPQNVGFKNLLIAKDTAGVKTGTYTMALQEIDNNVWFTNIWDQVGKADLRTGKITLFTKPLQSVGYSWYSEGALAKDKNNLPLVLNGESVYEINESNGKVMSQRAPGLFHIHQSENGKTYYFVKTDVEKTFCRNDTIYGNQFFYDAEDDQNGNIWIGTSKGLIRLDTKTNAITQFQHDDKQMNSISSDFIYALEVDHKNQDIWMAAYNGGLCSYHIPSGKFRHYSREDGLADNIVYSIEKDHHGNLWFSTNAGISTYNITNHSFRHYGVADGLLNHEFDRQTSCRNAAGWIFFGGILGIDYFHPDSIVKNNTQPELAFTNFRVFNKDYIPSGDKVSPHIDLNYKDSYIAIEFSALDYNSQQKIQYAYKLNNSKEWVKLANQHSLSFSDLPTGSHHLYIRSTNNEGIWLDNAISCTIVVHPAWWQTAWFRVGLALIFILLAILLVRYYYRRKLEKQMATLEKQQAIEKERTRIATDMHDDLGAGLSRIKFLSETIGIKKQQQQPIEEDITKIREYSHEMIDKMGEIVWALNEKNDSLNDLLSYTRSYAVEYLSQMGITCTVDAPEYQYTGFVSGEFRRNIFLSVKESLHNVSKHARASHVSITMNISNQLVIVISDNGVGFNPSHRRKHGNGLLNIEKRMKDIDGTVKIVNGKGTEIRLVAPLPAA